MRTTISHTRMTPAQELDEARRRAAEARRAAEEAARRLAEVTKGGAK